MTRTRALALTLMLALASSAHAQLGTTADQPAEGATAFTNGKAPVPKKADSDPPTLWGYFCVLVIVGAVIGTNLIPSKRGHQD